MGFPTKCLNNGVEMPVLGLGIYLMENLNEMKQAVESALKAGYRSLDTAQMYGNEALLGETLQTCGMARKELFLTSKVDNGNQGYENTLTSFSESLKKLKTDYLDLFLIHWPGQQKARLLDTWRAMEKLYQDGLVRAIGVCNCEPQHLEWILEKAQIIPAINQVEHHPLFQDEALALWCREKGIQMEAWAPLIRGSFDLPGLKEIAEKYNKSPAQIILRWNIQKDYIAIPKSIHPNRILENADLFDFSLEEKDIAVLDQMNQGQRTSFDPRTFDF